MVVWRFLTKYIETSRIDIFEMMKSMRRLFPSVLRIQRRNILHEGKYTNAPLFMGARPNRYQVGFLQNHWSPVHTGCLRFSTQPDMRIEFTCNVCKERSTKSFTKNSYEKGLVIVRCAGCESLHLIADNIGWFSHFNHKNVEEFLAEKGEMVKRGIDTTNNDDGTLEYHAKEDHDCNHHLSSGKKVEPQ